MKIKKKLYYLLLSLVFFSCENDKEAIYSAGGLTLIKNNTVLSAPILAVSDKLNNFALFEWNEAKTGVESASTYKLFIFDSEKDPSLLNPIEYTGINIADTPSSKTINVEEVNKMLNQLPNFQCGQMSIDFRIKSTLGNSASSSESQYSNPINVKVIGYNLKPLELAFVKNNDLVNSSTTKLLSVSNIARDFEGYFYLQSGDYKFNLPDDCRSYTTPTVIGQGASIGSLSASGANINIPTAGYYYIKANITAGTYSIQKYKTFGITGNATRLGSGGAFIIPMSDPEKDNIWTIEMSLVKGRVVRFQANNWNDVALTVPPPADPPLAIPNLPYIPPADITGSPSLLGFFSDTELTNVSGTLGTITVPGGFDNFSRQKFRVTIDVRNPRKYTYSFVKI